MCVCVWSWAHHMAAAAAVGKTQQKELILLFKKKKKTNFYFFFFNQIASRSWLDQPHCITYTTVCRVLFPESPHYEQLRVLVHETIDKTKVVDQPSDH